MKDPSHVPRIMPLKPSIDEKKNLERLCSLIHAICPLYKFKDHVPIPGDIALAADAPASTSAP